MIKYIILIYSPGLTYPITGVISKKILVWWRALSLSKYTFFFFIHPLCLYWDYRVKEIIFEQTPSFRGKGTALQLL